MCGICGKYSPAGVRVNDIQPMLEAIIHRGPDDEGVYVNGRIGLGNRRLSIIDLPGGRQPIANEDETIWVVYNGEIYNYPALRHELQQRGHTFRTQSDTEVIVHLYEEMGRRCVEKLRGMFAFALWDGNQQKLLLARDRIGQKPLFYAQVGDDLLFGSEIKSILAINKSSREIDYEALHHYLSLRFIPSPQTMLKQIKKLPPAHTLVWHRGEATLSRYWDLSFTEKLALNEQQYIHGLQEKLNQAISSHLISDVPVGAFLSGGLDSSIIVAVMAQDLGLTTRTFAVGVTGQEFNELPFARQVATHHATDHTEERVTSDLITALPQMIWHLDEPSDPIAACQYHAAAVAARHVKVVLGGDGGDELFAGFDRYAGMQYVDYYALLPAVIRRRLLEPALDRIADSFAYKNRTQQLRWLHQLSLLPDTAARYAEATLFSRFNHADKQALFSDDLWQQVGHLHSSEIIARTFRQAPATTLLDRMLYADYMTRLPEHSLMLTDRMTMAHSLELRSPLVDHELVEYLAAFPGQMKIRGRQLKYILRRLAENYLPPAIVQREKHGFMFPVAYWFREEWHEPLRRVLLDSHFVREGLLRPERIELLLAQHRHNQVDHHNRLWLLLNLEIWHQLYIEQVSLAEVTDRLATVSPERNTLQ
ncbi:MAG: asparagine synthase (glutamine-hydrolyzing) [Chloroflexota bacterium]|jgi:asparagine synthase (glutamine-hydrolysing)